MTTLSFTQIEDAQFAYRQARRPLQAKILRFLLTSGQITNPFLALNRMFVRLKSADSIVEKIKRKKLPVETVVDLQKQVTDVLGLRLITETMPELQALDAFFQDNFTVTARKDFVSQPNEFGYQTVEYELRYQDVPFEVQLRTTFQHQWSVNSFFLFHKTSPEVARPHQATLQELSQSLSQAQNLAASLVAGGSDSHARSQKPIEYLETLPVQACINLMVINPGELFVEHMRLPLGQDERANHDQIVNEKARLYEVFPGAAVVECACMHVSTYALNEPHVIFLPEFFDRIHW